MTGVTVRASTSGVSRTGGATQTFPFPGTPQVGDPVAILITSDTNTILPSSIPSGWTTVYNTTVVNGARTFIWKTYASGDGSSLNITFPSQPNIAYAVVVLDGSVHTGFGTIGTVTTRSSSVTTASAVQTGSTSVPNLVVFHEKASTHTSGPTIAPTTTTIQSAWDTTSGGASVFVGSYDTSGGLADRTATYSTASGNGAGFQIPVALAAVSGSLSLSGSGTLSFGGAPRMPGTLALTGSGSLSLSGGVPVPKVRVYRSEMATLAVTTPKVRVYRSEMATVAPVTPKVRVYRSEMTTTRSVALVPLTSLTNILPETNVTFTALMTTGDIADSYTWRQISGPTVTFNGTGNTRTFRAPSSMSTISVVIGVTATIGTKTSPEQQATVTVLPQTKWMYINGAWVGRQPAVFL